MCIEGTIKTRPTTKRRGAGGRRGVFIQSTKNKVGDRLEAAFCSAQCTPGTALVATVWYTQGASAVVATAALQPRAESSRIVTYRAVQQLQEQNMASPHIWTCVDDAMFDATDVCHTSKQQAPVPAHDLDQSREKQTNVHDG